MYCKICGGFSYGSYRHRCPPKWTCCHTEHDGDPSEHETVYASDVDEAATTFAERWWNDAPPDQDDTINVSVFVNGAPVHYIVIAEYTLSGRAREVKPT